MLALLTDTSVSVVAEVEALFTIAFEHIIVNVETDLSTRIPVFTTTWKLKRENQLKAYCWKMCFDLYDAYMSVSIQFSKSDKTVYSNRCTYQTEAKQKFSVTQHKHTIFPFSSCVIID